jgi:predicted SAM-dependent methyltransferase
MTTKYSICNKDYQVNLTDLFKFELRSLYGRIILKSKPKLQKKCKNLLNLGCGTTYFQGWVNADFFVNIIKFWQTSAKNPDWMLDLRFPLNCDDNVWDGIFSEHTLEHLYPDHALQLLKELYRTIKPGAWLRISVPDLKKYVKYYCGEEVHELFNRWQTGCEAIRTLTQDYGHLSVWDSTLLAKFLKEAGFINVQEVFFMQGTDKLLLKDQQDRAWESLYMEAQKPMNYQY